MTAASEPKAATLTALNADLIGSTVQGTIALREGGSVNFYLTGANAEKAKDAAKAALKDALASL